MYEQQGPKISTSAAKSIPIKPEAPRPSSPPPLPLNPNEMEEWQRYTQAMVLQTTHPVMGHMQELFQNNLEQQTKVFKEQAERMEAIAQSLKKECVEYKSTAEGLAEWSSGQVNHPVARGRLVAAVVGRPEHVSPTCPQAVEDHKLIGGSIRVP